MGSMPQVGDEHLPLEDLSGSVAARRGCVGLDKSGLPDRTSDVAATGRRPPWGVPCEGAPRDRPAATDSAPNLGSVSRRCSGLR